MQKKKKNDTFDTFFFCIIQVSDSGQFLTVWSINYDPPKKEKHIFRFDFCKSPPKSGHKTIDRAARSKLRQQPPGSFTVKPTDYLISVDLPES